jgi:hypothetical protein
MRPWAVVEACAARSHVLAAPGEVGVLPAPLGDRLLRLLDRLLGEVLGALDRLGHVAVGLELKVVSPLLELVDALLSVLGGPVAELDELLDGEVRRADDSVDGGQRRLLGITVGLVGRGRLGVHVHLLGSMVVRRLVPVRNGGPGGELRRCVDDGVPSVLDDPGIGVEECAALRTVEPGVVADRDTRVRPVRCVVRVEKPGTDIQRLGGQGQALRELLQDLRARPTKAALDLRQIRVADTRDGGQLANREICRDALLAKVFTEFPHPRRRGRNRGHGA